jgi:hypothetical protein
MSEFFAAYAVTFDEKYVMTRSLAAAFCATSLVIGNARPAVLRRVDLDGIVREWSEDGYITTV